MASLRDEMPQTAAFIDMIREVFCETPEDLASLNRNIRAGFDGHPTFYACENGREVGTKDTRQGVIPATLTRAELEARRAADGAAGQRTGIRGARA